MLGLLREKRDTSKDSKDLANIYHHELEDDIRIKLRALDQGTGVGSKT